MVKKKTGPLPVNGLFGDIGSDVDVIISRGKTHPLQGIGMRARSDNTYSLGKNSKGIGDEMQQAYVQETMPKRTLVEKIESPDGAYSISVYDDGLIIHQTKYGAHTLLHTSDVPAYIAKKTAELADPEQHKHPLESNTPTMFFIDGMTTKDIEYPPPSTDKEPFIDKTPETDKPTTRCSLVNELLEKGIFKDVDIDED